MTGVTQTRQALRVKAGSTAKIEEGGWLAGEQIGVNPIHVLADDSDAAGGSIMCLGEMLVQHASGEPRLVPGDVVPFRPGKRWGGSIYQVSELHGE
jgi:hypothetical protein